MQPPFCSLDQVIRRIFTETLSNVGSYKNSTIITPLHFIREQLISQCLSGPKLSGRNFRHSLGAKLVRWLTCFRRNVNYILLHSYIAWKNQPVNSNCTQYGFFTIIGGAGGLYIKRPRSFGGWGHNGKEDIYQPFQQL